MKAKMIAASLIFLLLVTIVMISGCDKRISDSPNYYITEILASPDTIYADNDNNTASVIQIVVKDDNDYPAALTEVKLKSNLGTIYPTVTTNSYGIAVTNFYDKGTPGTATIEASIDGSKQTVTVTILAPVGNSITKLIVEPDTIYADNNTITNAQIQAIVKHPDGSAVVGDSVYFNTDLGTINSFAVTNDFGIATATFNDDGEIGIASINAFTDFDSKTTFVTVIEKPANSYIDRITANPDSIISDNDTSTYSTIKVYVKTPGGFPLAGETVSFQSSLGSIIASAVTDNSGIASVSFHDDGALGTATIQASIENDSKSVNVQIINPAPAYIIDRITATPDTIYADYNVTYSTIEVLVKDQDGFPLPEKIVRFRSNIGSIITQVTTDNSGIASTTFWDSGDLGIATIDAFVDDISAQIHVTIIETPDIDPAEFKFDVNFNSVNIDEIKLIRVKAKNTLGNIVPDGTIITISSDKGYFQSTLEDATDLGGTVQVQTSNGAAKTYLNFGSQTGDAILMASLSGNEITKTIEILPGSPVYMRLYPDTTMVMAGSGQSVQIAALVEDRHHNPVGRDIGVSFATTLGTIGQFANTDETGYAHTIFSPGITAGLAQITAESDSANASTIINVVSEQVNSIKFSFSGQVDIQAQGTGGQESYELRVNLYDMNGNLVNEDRMVYFELLNSPSGTNINNVGIADSVISTSGQAVVSINSGVESGIVRVKAYTFNNNGTMIQSTKSNIVVHAGAPNSVEFSISGHDSGEDMGGGVWKVQVAAILTDSYGNPVDNGTAVFFSLVTDSAWVSIEADAFVGNENANGDSLEGTAFTFLTYEGTHTNDAVVVRVETGDFWDEGELILPIQFPYIDIVATPQHVSWTETSNPSYKTTNVRIKVLDGQNNPIDNQVVIFTSTRGEPQGAGPDGTSFTGLTGIDNQGIHGRIDKLFRFYKYECPAPSPAGPGSTTATITAQILGTQTTNNVTVILYRYVE